MKKAVTWQLHLTPDNTVPMFEPEIEKTYFGYSMIIGKDKATGTPLHFDISANTIKRLIQQGIVALGDSYYLP